MYSTSGALQLLSITDGYQLYWGAIVAAREQVASHQERGPHETGRAEAVQQETGRAEVGQEESGQQEFGCFQMPSSPGSASDELV